MPELPSLSIRVQGRIIDHLGIQMYQSPTAAISELIANAWDADAETVAITIPEYIGEETTIEIKDNGNGMTAAECQSRFLAVGACRRASGSSMSEFKKRPVLGKKGIGKFAGFGIATEITVDTTSIKNGERTVFVMNLQELRDEGEDISNKKINVIDYAPPNEANISNHGTILTLRSLTLSRSIPIDRFSLSMARRFSLNTRNDNFLVTINGSAISNGFDDSNVEFDFPSAYRDQEKPQGITIDDKWGIEYLPNGKLIKWRFLFNPIPIDDEELRGISVFCKGKMAQRPFTFNLTGGLGGQHGLEYLSGRVEADYVDDLPVDLISPERQRIDWEHTMTLPFQDWGQKRIKALLRIWKDRRTEAKTQAIENKIASFSRRLDKLPPHEQKTVHSALKKIAEIDTLDGDKLNGLCDSILTSWEGGRLKDLISSITEVENPSAQTILELLMEAQVLTALNTAEVVKTKIAAIAILEKAIASRTLENSLRNYIAAHPDLLDPRWETYKVETSLRHIVEQAEKEAKIDPEEKDLGKRVDLLLRGGDSLLVVEFMRPGLATDRDHLNRLELYVQSIETQVTTRTELHVRKVFGLCVADRPDDNPLIMKKVASLESQAITAMTWTDMLERAKHTWSDFLAIVKMRAPDDERVAAL